MGRPTHRGANVHLTTLWGGGMNVCLRELAADQYDLVAAWQLLDRGWTRRMIDHGVEDRGWGVVHPGVYALTSAPLTQSQKWMAATLTAPGTVLSHGSAGACWGFRSWPGSFEAVTRPGNGGPRRMGNVRVYRSRRLEGDVARREGVPITTATRTLIDLARRLGPRATGRTLREALRLKTTTTGALLASLESHEGRPGTAVLLELAARYARVPYSRTRSDAEAFALELLQDAGVEAPRVNTRIAGEEADLWWPERRLIIEIDGPQYHRFAEEDARKQALWEAAGQTVRRIPSGVVYERPTRLIALARAPTPEQTSI
ncbi:MAG: hypothetical protein QOK25_606 [Thermoleophilaceae bacterium]|nr:hypothetical protein [Thermoleophilaceae bacterium]